MSIEELGPGRLADVRGSEERTAKLEIVGVTKDSNFQGSLIVKTRDTQGAILGYALRKNSHGDWEGSEIRYAEDGSIGAVYQLHEADLFGLKESGVLEAYENLPEMKERVTSDSELLNKRNSSKKFLSAERKALAKEIREQRTAQRGRLDLLKSDAETAKISPENIKDSNYANLSERQSSEADVTSVRLASSELDEQDAVDEQENIDRLLDCSDKIKDVREMLQRHYMKADALAKSEFETMRKSVEQTMIRNNVFIVHTFLLNEELRHNDNSNIAKRATLEDDIDILLALEPSISTSSVIPGSKQGLWGGRVGVVLGGGDIRGVAQTDNGTVTRGIKMRNGEVSSSKEIDEKVSDDSERGYNELVVNNPEVFGFFQLVETGESGQMRGFEKTDSEQQNRKRKDDFMKYMDLAIQKGMPPYVMTPDRKLYEFLAISNEGVVSAGNEITPELAAKGRAGLVKVDRARIGRKVIDKNLFKNIDDQREAKGIVAEMSNADVTDADLSHEEYLAFIRDNKGGFENFPQHLLADMDFMQKAAQFNPVSAYQYAGENLKHDKDFVRHVYAIEKQNITSSIYALMPSELRKDEEMAILAIENNDFDNLDSSLADSTVVWDKILDKLVEKNNPDNIFSRNIGEQEVFEISLRMSGEQGLKDMTEKLIADKSFLEKLQNKYPSYAFEIDDYKQLLVTKQS